MILAKVLQSTVQGRAWECGSCMLFMLYFKEEIHSPNIDDVGLKRLENNHASFTTFGAILINDFLK